MRNVGGEVVEAIAPNDGNPLSYVQGTPLTLHLPPESLRVFAPHSGPDEPAPHGSSG
jgi:hypothetical protein